MARILFTWELGGGLGHIAVFQPLAARLIQNGHQVFAALKDLSRAQPILGEIGVRIFQAPFKIRNGSNFSTSPTNYAQLLQLVGFGDLTELAGLAAAWNSLCQCVDPDLIIFDHSPTAMLATLPLRAKRVLFGTGFCCPPISEPSPLLRPQGAGDCGGAASAEISVLHNVNAILQRSNVEPLGRIMDLYARIEQRIMNTFEELDHFGPRTQESTEYWGIGSSPGGMAPSWPAGLGKRVFAYLKPFPSIANLLESLERFQLPTLVFADGISRELRARYSNRAIRFVDQPVCLGTAGAECDFAILNGTHATTAALLLAGKPILQAPIYLEQFLIAKRVERMGAGLFVDCSQPQQIDAALTQMIGSETMPLKAREFQTRYRHFDQASATQAMTAQIERILL